MRKFYYARLNDNNICVEIVSSVYKYPKDIKGYVEIFEYNETLYYKKWLGDQWSQETYEPEIDTVIQDKLEELENAKIALTEENLELKLALADLAETYENKITELQLAMAELAEMGV